MEFEILKTEEPAEPELPAGEETDAQSGELPYGFRGMPHGYVLSEKELKAKRALADHGVLEGLQKLEAGLDYVDGEVLFASDSEEYAQMVADAYNAELVSCSSSFAVMKLRTATVLEAVTASVDPDLPLPAVEPNMIIGADPEQEIEGRVLAYDLESRAGEDAPTLQDWNAWYQKIMESGKTPDPYLRDPWDKMFQYMHSAVYSFAAWGVIPDASNVRAAVIGSGITSHSDVSAANIMFPAVRFTHMARRRMLRASSGQR